MHSSLMFWSLNFAVLNGYNFLQDIELCNLLKLIDFI